METNVTDTVVAIIREVLTKLNVGFSNIVISESLGSTVFTIQTNESPALIGADGEPLAALDHLIKRMVEKQLPPHARITIDVNGYHQRGIKAQEDQARVVGERARTFKYDIELPPMSAYERMIVHSTLKGVSDIETISHGEGPLRHIVVHYKDPNAPPSLNEESL